MSKFLKTTLIWGFLLWLIGYLLGIVLFFLVSPEMLGWVLSPIGIAITLWVLFEKISAQKISQYLQVGFIWTVFAVVLDYLLLVQLFKPVDGYYKLDVYFYYLTTLLLPVLVGWYKVSRKGK